LGEEDLCPDSEVAQYRECKKKNKPMKHLFITFIFILLLIPTQANDLPFQNGEELKFDIHYKYGLLMLKAGSANYKIENGSYKNHKSFNSTLDFKTTSFFDKIFKMRDTLRSYIAEDLTPLYHIRSIHEGNYNFTEEVFINKFSPTNSEVRIKRESKEILKIDTILSTNTIGYDILNLIQFIRSQDYSKWRYVPSGNISTFVGKDIVTITVRCEGQSIVEKSETHKFKTYKIALDFTDNVFNESKSAIEIWMSDDENRIPIKIRAKLRIGMAEVYLTSWKNLKYPFSAEVIIPVKKK